MTAAYFQAAQFYFEIAQGSHFHLEWPPFMDAETGEPFDFVADGAWVGRMDVRDGSGNLVATFRSNGGGDGTIAFDSAGVVSADLPAAKTAALTPTQQYARPGLPSKVYADLELVDPTTNEPWRFFRGHGKITQEVTQ